MMRKLNSTGSRSLILLGCAALLLLFSSQVWSADDSTPATPSSSVVVTGITKPSEERHLAFGGAGLVADVAVKEGDPVTEKQVLASQDSRQDEFTLKSDEREANSTEKIDYSQADYDLKKVVYDRKKKLMDEFKGASNSEVEEAELAVKLAAAQIALAKLEHDQKGWDADKQRAKIDQMKITSPINGVVEKINIGKGEMADPQNKDGSIVVGQWDPLWLEVHLPSAQASQLKLNQVLPVKYEGGQWQTAKIIFFEKVDAASDTQMVRLELANPGSAKVPGLHMQIKLPDNVTAVAASDGH